MIKIFKWIKSFHKTLKEKPYGEIWMVYGLFLAIISLIALGITSGLENIKGAIISAILLILSFGIMLKPVIIDTIKDIRKFLKEVKQNIE